MKSRFIRSVLLAALVAVPMSSMAWDKIDSIAEVRVEHGNRTLIRFNVTNWHGCSGSPFFLLSEGDSVSPHRKNMAAVAMTAMALGRNVLIVTGTSGGDSPQCSGPYEWVYNLSIFAQ